MKKLTKNILSALSIFLVLILLFSSIVLYQEQQLDPVPLSEIVQDIQDDSVSKIRVENNWIYATLEDDTEKKAEKEESGTLFEVLQGYGLTAEDIQGIDISVSNNQLSSLLLSAGISIIGPIILIVGLLWLATRQAQKGGMQAMSFGKSSARMTLPSKDKKKKLGFDDIAGLKEAKEELHEIVEFLKNPQKFTAIGAKIPKGVLLIGPPGTGKTLLARAVANEAEVPFFYTSGSEFVEMFVGVGASRIRDMFKTAEKNSPSLIFIDELDAIGRSRGNGLGGGNDEREQTLNQILVEMDGFETNKGLIVIGATNRPEVLDKALLRPGRFDRQIRLDLPDIKEREQIISVHAKGKPIQKSVSFRKIAERTPGFSGAEINNLLNEAAIYAARQEKKSIDELDILESIDKVLMGPEKRSRVITDKEKEIVAYHESGHAITGHYLQASDPVQKVTIIARGGAGGYTLKLPSEDRRLHSRSEFEADMAVALGGYVAEEMIFGEMTTGASNDIQKLTQIAEQYVRYYGMSKLGPIHYADYPSMQSGETPNFSQKTLESIDQEVTKIIHRAYQTCRQTLEENHEALDRLAQTLIKIETVERNEFLAIMEGTYTIPEEPDPQGEPPEKDPSDTDNDAQTSEESDQEEG